MSDKLNCWQFKNCGREPGGLLVDQLGVCPVARALQLDGTNDGVAGGRICWRVPDAGCPDGADCHTCEFYRRVLFEQSHETIGRFESVTA